MNVAQAFIGVTPLQRAKTMAEYIKREDAISAVCFGCNQQFSDEPCEPSDCSIRQAIMATPTADAVEVVRCKDCKYWGKHGGCIPHEHLHKCYRQYGAAMSENDFCSLGEKGEALYD